MSTDGDARGLDAPVPAVHLQDILAHLRRPFAPLAVKWKVQTEWGRGAIVIAYIDARLVVERLNAVCPAWRTAYAPAPDGALRCELEVLAFPFLGASEAIWIPRSDVGVGQGTAQMKLKAANSDALKRAAVMWGVGVSIYAMSAVTLDVGEGDGDLRTEEKNKKQKDGSYKKVQVAMVDRRSKGWLAGMYERWLEARGEGMFGPVLDHGDEADAAGIDETPALDVAQQQDAAAEGGDEPVTGAPQQMADELAKELRIEAEGVFGMLRKLAPRKMVPALFRTRLEQHGGSHEQLRAFIDELRALVRENGGDA